MEKLIKIDEDINKALTKILKEFPGEETYDNLINHYVRTYIELFFTNGKDILNR